MVNTAMVNTVVMEEPKTKWAPDDIRNAYEACTNERLSIYAAAKMYGVPRTTLSDRVNNKVSMNTRVGHPTSLSTTEEDSLINYVYYMSECGFPPSREDLIHYAGAIDLQRPEEQRCFKDTGPSLTWWKRFRDRHPDLSIKTAQTIQVMIPLTDILTCLRKPSMIITSVTNLIKSLIAMKVWCCLTYLQRRS